MTPPVKPKPANMREVARQAGVSTSAVWAVFRKHDAAATTIGVSAEARQKILAVAAKLHYKPDILARSFTNNRSFLLGLLMRETFEDFSMPLLRGIQDVCLDHDYSVITYAHGNSAADERRHLKFSLDRRVDGLIVMPALDRDGDNNFARLQALRADGMPVVQLFNSLVPGVPAVARDHEATGYLATCRLLELGHRRILHLTFEGYDDTGVKGFHIDAKQRYEGYARAMREAGQAPLVYAHGPITEGGREFHDAVLASADAILRHPGAPTAVMPYNDYQAWGLLEACAERRIRVPEELSVIGCDGIREMWIGSGQLATFTYPLRDMGRAAATLCLDMMKGGMPQDTIFPPVYQDGATVAPPTAKTTRARPPVQRCRMVRQHSAKSNKKRTPPNENANRSNQEARDLHVELVDRGTGAAADGRSGGEGRHPAAKQFRRRLLQSPVDDFKHQLLWGRE